MIRYILAVIFVLSTLWVGEWAVQDSFHKIIISFSVLFGIYALCINRAWKDESLWFWIWTGTLGRISLVFVFPSLSDDVYRFYWDALVIAEGVSPYQYTPAEITHSIMETHKDVFEQLNSPGYYSVYPPVNQVLYWVALQVSSGLEGFSMALKSIFLILEMAGLYFIYRILMSTGQSLQWMIIYWLNPLVMIEGVGNLHIEVIMVSFLAGLYYCYFIKNRPFQAAGYFSLAMGVKIVPLIISPFLYFSKDKKTRILFTSVTILITSILFLPVFVNHDFRTFFQSLDLYFRKFEFNASIYYLLRFVGYILTGYNQIAWIGPGLSAIFAFIVLYFAVRLKKSAMPQLLLHFLIIWTVFLCISTTVHPWYIIPIIFLGTLTGNIYPLVWSYLVVFSYILYDTGLREFYYWVVWIEYILVGGIAWWEIKKAPIRGLS